MNRILLALLVVISFFTAPVLSAPIEGVYSASGTNPGGRGSYKGTVTISRTHQTYKIVWNVGSVFIGTGIVTGDTLSVAYTDEHKKWFGIVSYKIFDNGKQLHGEWSAHGGKSVGTEKLIKR